MKKSLVFAMAMALGVSATAFAANPFSDLPAGHWAYGAVAKLAAAGVVDGYLVVGSISPIQTGRFFGIVLFSCYISYFYVIKT